MLLWQLEFSKFISPPLLPSMNSFSLFHLLPRICFAHETKHGRKYDQYHRQVNFLTHFLRQHCLSPWVFEIAPVLTISN